MTTPIPDPVQQAAEVITRVGEAHQAAITAWSHDTDPATARTPPADLTSLDLAQALAAAWLIATEAETRTTTTCAGPNADGEGCPDWWRYRSCAHTITQTRNVTPWKDPR